ncbi:hemerythrin HHE cation binding domain-containing protein [Stackebrandtia albiflava]|uniref:Hemerythrin HHE cation binding domain-containing protein n=1 Tax=Stackebrandtia albiflava TaxID=406432 RepID=A0A562VAV6_9ACTN|nr:hemerythrin domain-containing protein [Stackebrandtia albiflava]TWJ14993.1 hemerythrin HHE cation binding domain-containing protein [Stackebrandtia albiflava]
MTDDRLTALGAELREVHRRLRRALALARTALDEGDEFEDASRDLLLYCRGFCSALTGHHRSEDRELFPLIVRARPDLRPVIAALTQDHNMIDHLIGGLEKAVAAGITPEEAHRHLDGIEAVMETHFRYEESKLLSVLDGIEGEFDTTRLLGPLA